MTRTTTALWGAIAITALAGFGLAPHAAAASACTDLGGTVGAEQTCHVEGTGPGYGLDFSFPVGYPDQQAITDFLTDQRDEIADYAKKFPPNARPAPYELNVTGTAYQRGMPQPATQSVVFEIQNDTGAANEGRPTISYHALNYDLGRGPPSPSPRYSNPARRRRTSTVRPVPALRCCRRRMPSAHTTTRTSPSTTTR